MNQHNILTQLYESGIEVNLQNNSYTPKQGNYNQPFIEWQINGMVSGLLHSHYIINSSSGLSGVFSADDVVFMAQIYLANLAQDSTNLFFGLTTSTGNPLIMKVKNTAAFRTFAERITTEFSGKKEIERLIIKRYNTKLNKPTQDESMAEFLKMLRDYGAEDALSLYQSTNTANDGSVGSWKRVKLTAFDNIDYIDCQ